MSSFHGNDGVRSSQCHALRAVVSRLGLLPSTDVFKTRMALSSVMLRGLTWETFLAVFGVLSKTSLYNSNKPFYSL